MPPPSVASERDREIAGRLVRGYLAHSRPMPDDQCILQQQPLDPLTSDVLRALICLTDDYEARYREQLVELSASWTVSADPRGSFAEVLDTIFADGCNWGRVVTIFIFLGLFLRKCREQRAPVTSKEAGEWTVDYLVEKIAPWIRENGDWTGLMKFHSDGDVAAQMPDDGRLFKRLLTLAGAAGLVVLGLTSLLANRA